VTALSGRHENSKCGDIILLQHSNIIEHLCDGDLLNEVDARIIKVDAESRLIFLLLKKQFNFSDPLPLPATIHPVEQAEAGVRQQYVFCGLEPTRIGGTIRCHAVVILTFHYLN
jgi:hypothetical protein